MSESLKRLRRVFHVTPRSAIESLLVCVGLCLAEPTLTSLLVGGGIALVGEVIRLWAGGYPALALRSGPCRFVRHPHILGSVLLFLGLATATANFYVMLLTLVSLPLAYRGRYLRAESAAKQLCGPWYADYEASVPALLPRLWPAAKDFQKGSNQMVNKLESIGFSLELSLLRGRHRELDTVLAMIIIAAVLYVLIRFGSQGLLQWSIFGILVFMAGVRTAYYRLR